MVPKGRLVDSASWVHPREDVKRLQDGGIGVLLIGEAFLRQADPGEALDRIIWPRSQFALELWHGK